MPTFVSHECIANYVLFRFV